MEKLYKKDLHDPDSLDGVITHLEPDMDVECEVKWVLGSINTNKASGGDRIPVELFQILKDDAVKVLALRTPANLENLAVATGLEKVSFHSKIMVTFFKRSHALTAAVSAPDPVAGHH